MEKAVSFTTFDLETTIKESYKRKANAFDPENWVVAAGYKHHAVDSETVYYLEPDQYRIKIPETTRMLIGFNMSRRRASSPQATSRQSIVSWNKVRTRGLFIA